MMFYRCLVRCIIRTEILLGIILISWRDEYVAILHPYPCLFSSLGIYTYSCHCVQVNQSPVPRTVGRAARDRAAMGLELTTPPPHIGPIRVREWPKVSKTDLSREQF